ncbi:MAG: hypothetical protein HY369_04545 [Candidatus Aenigmarchaeota archaeon]|nr:hypothetical protein [Candidatus Aenigmarchaeota archaeon]
MNPRELILPLALFLVVLASGCTQQDFQAANEAGDSSPIDAGTCTKPVFEYPPVDLDETSILVPLGLMFGNHVTPVDHQYFQNYAEPEKNIAVYSPGDGRIRTIQHMSGTYYDAGKGQEVEWDDYRLEIEHACGVSSTFIHIDTLSDKIAQHAPEKGKNVVVDIPVAAGEGIGHYTGNVDYNLVDVAVILPGLLVPEHYEREPWKIHVPDTLQYFTDPIRTSMIAKSIRTAEPVAGKFDHDIDGRLIGNWFEEGTNGYAGANLEKYWVGHLSISPDYIDPNHVIVSMGDFADTEKQFGVAGNAPDPADVSVVTGLVEYALVDYDYFVPDGSLWDKISVAKGITAKNGDDVQGVILLQLVEDRKLRVEIFPGKKAMEVSGFTASAKMYER